MSLNRAYTFSLLIMRNGSIDILNKKGDKEMIEVMYKGCIQGRFESLEEIKKYYEIEEDQMIILDGLVIIKAF